MFAKNQRISHRQLYRQVILTLMAPFLLTLPGWQNLRGINGVIGIAVCLIVWAGFVILLVRLAPAYEHMTRYVGKIPGLVIGILYGGILIFTGAYLLRLAEELTLNYLLEGYPQWLIGLLLTLVCVVGSHMGMEKRSRMGEVSFVIVFGAVLLLIALSLFQKNQFAPSEFWQEGIVPEKILAAFWGSFCAFLPLTLLPFILSGVSKQGSGGKVLYASVATLGILLMVLLYLLPVILGWNRMMAEERPMLPYMAGTNLPGDVLARFDVIWVGLLLYGLLFPLGSVFYYCHHIFQKVHCPVPQYILGALVYGLSLVDLQGKTVADYYPGLFLKVFAPLFLLVLLWIYCMFKRRRKS